MRSSPRPTSVASSSSAAAITSSRSRATSRRWKPTSPWPSGRIPPSAEWAPAPDVARVETVEKGHGRIEIRRLECSESLASYLSQWPGLRQVCRIERRRSLRGKDSIEVVHAITSLSRERADAASLLNIARGHWGIENRLHYVRDRTCREDACRARARPPPHCQTRRGGLGKSRPACTTSAIGPAARTPAAPDLATPPRPSPPCETPPSPFIDAAVTVPSRARSTSPNIATRRSPSSNKREPNDPPFRRSPLDMLLGRWTLDYSPMYLTMDIMARLFSPYDFTLGGTNPLEEILASSVNFERLSQSAIRLFVTTTNVQTGRGRV